MMDVAMMPWEVSGMRALNRKYETPVRATLTRLVAAAGEHARFLHMLSMLEHIGSRKIMLSQMGHDLPEDTLKHLAEEARHAHFFKRQAERLAGHKLPGYDAANTTAFGAARMYFGRLDAWISRQVDGAAAYPWVSLIVELRACWLYAIYQEVLQQAGAALSLKSLLAEEDLHLAEMYATCGADADLLRRMSAFETALFASVWAQVEADSAGLAAA